MNATTPAPDGEHAVSPPPPASVDVLIIGAGPAGLALATTLHDEGFEVALVERQNAAALRKPTPDGRDIALTHRAMAWMRAHDLWDRLPADEIAPLRAARVLHGAGAPPLDLRPRPAQAEMLGQLVPNHLIRRASFEAVSARPGIQVAAGWSLAELDLGSPKDAQARTTLRSADGQSAAVRARLVVAADSRLSETRRRAGIGAEMRDFGRTVILMRMAHERGHEGIALEGFFGAQTVAVLPMNGLESSIVVTVPAAQAPAMQAWPAEQFARWVQGRLANRLGAMHPLGERHAYPLVSVYAHRFVSRRFALVGDAAVGMHPVTAHGYNFGLYGVESLTRAVVQARRQGQDIGALDSLRAHEMQHRRETRLIYEGTNLVVGLFTDERPWALGLGRAVLQAARHLGPLQHLITQRLTAQTPAPAWWPA